LHAGLGGGSIGPLDGQWLRAAVLAPITALAVLFLLRHGGWRHRWIDRALGLQCLVMPLSLLLLPPPHTFVTATTWYALFAVQLMAAAAWSVWRIAARDRTAAWRTASVVGIAGVLICCELAAQAGLLSLAAARLAQVGLALLLLVFAFRLVQTFVDALRGAEAARLTMEVRVTEATAEIERNFAQLAELRVEQVTEKERKRIAADLHDDLGAKLLTIVHTSESERIATLAREALEEMRLSVRGLTGKPVRAADALADWRAETVARLGQAGIEADWRSPSDEIEQRLAARTYVQTTRILREAVSNIIKHSGASHCKVRCTFGTDEFMLIIQDNGRGISDEMSGKLDRGQGMYSMKNRAKQMQGQCLVESGPGYGTVIRLTLPLTERAPAAAQT
jgi:signal transduction histidine kinase